ncbi:MAG: tetratricopeptide repeat protein [Deinococcus sp.]|nr:tetratricopeptide repeat protein [Deinococcus sp.]
MVASPLPDLMPWREFVEFYSSPGDIAAAVERALSSNGPGSADRRREAAGGQQWSERALALSEMIRGVAAGDETAAAGERDRLELRSRAISAFRAAADMAPSSPVLNMRLSEICLAEGDTDGSTRFMARALDAGVADAEPVRTLRLLALLDRTAEALALAARVARSTPSDPALQSYMTRLQGWAVNAGLIESDSGRALLRARLLRYLGETEKAAEVLEQAGSRWPDAPGLSAEMGHLAYARGDRERAVELYAAAMEGGYRDDLEFYVNLGRLFLARARVDDAENAFNAALELDPRCQEAIEGLARTYKLKVSLSQRDGA